MSVRFNGMGLGVYYDQHTHVSPARVPGVSLSTADKNASLSEQLPQEKARMWPLPASAVYSSHATVWLQPISSPLSHLLHTHTHHIFLLQMLNLTHLFFSSLLLLELFFCFECSFFFNLLFVPCRDLPAVFLHPYLTTKHRHILLLTHYSCSWNKHACVLFKNRATF